MISVGSDQHQEYCEWLVNRACEGKTPSQQAQIQSFYSTVLGHLTCYATAIDCCASGLIASAKISHYVSALRVLLSVIPLAGEALSKLSGVTEQERMELYYSSARQLLSNEPAKTQILRRISAEATYYHHMQLLYPNASLFEYYFVAIRDLAENIIKTKFHAVQDNEASLLTAIILKFNMALALGAVNPAKYPITEPDRAVKLILKQMIIVGEAPLIDRSPEPPRSPTIADRRAQYNTRLIEDYPNLELPPVKYVPPKDEIDERPAPICPRIEYSPFLELPTMESWLLAYRSLRANLLIKENEQKIRELAEKWGYNTRDNMAYEFKLFEKSGIRCLILANHIEILVVFDDDSSLQHAIIQSQTYTTTIKGIGQIHAGIARAYHAIKPELHDLLAFHRKFNSKKPCYYIGHGIGGAIAALGMADDVQSQHPVQAFTFGQPPFGVHYTPEAEKNFNDHLFRFACPDDIVVRELAFRHVGHLYILHEDPYDCAWDTGEKVSIRHLRYGKHDLLNYERRVLVHGKYAYPSFNAKKYTKKQRKLYSSLGNTKYLEQQFSMRNTVSTHASNPPPFSNTFSRYLEQLRSLQQTEQASSLIALQQMLNRYSSLPTELLFSLDKFIRNIDLIRYPTPIQKVLVDLYIHALMQHYITGNIYCHFFPQSIQMIRDAISILSMNSESELLYSLQDLEFYLDFHVKEILKDGSKYSPVFAALQADDDEPLNVYLERVEKAIQSLKSTFFFNNTGNHSDAEAFAFSLLSHSSTYHEEAVIAAKTFIFSKKMTPMPQRWHRAALALLLRAALNQSNHWRTIIGEHKVSVLENSSHSNTTTILQHENMMIGFSHWLQETAQYIDQPISRFYLIDILERLRAEKPDDVLLERLCEALSDRAHANKNVTKNILNSVLQAAGQDEDLDTNTRLKAWHYYEVLLSHSHTSLSAEDLMHIGQCATMMGDDAKALQSFKTAYQLLKQKLEKPENTQAVDTDEHSTLRVMLTTASSEVCNLLLNKARKKKSPWDKSLVYSEALDFLPKDTPISHPIRRELFQCVLSHGLKSIKNGLQEIAEPYIYDHEKSMDNDNKDTIFIQDFFGEYWKIKQQYANDLFNGVHLRADNKLRNPNHQDIHNVAEVGNLHIKENPGACGLAFSAWAFSACFFLSDRPDDQAPGFVPALPAKIIRSKNDRLETTYVQITPHVQGVNFKSFIDNKSNDEIHQSIELKSFSAITLLSFFMDLEDGRPQNMILGENVLTSIDNDHILIRDAFKEETLELKNILFCLDLMNKPVHNDVRSHFIDITRSPLHKLRLWLCLLEIYTQQIHFTYSDDEIRSLFNKSRDEDKVILEPFFHEEAMARLYLKCFKIRTALSQEVTLHEIHEQVHSAVAEYYKDNRKPDDSISIRFRRIMPQTQTASTAVIASKIVPRKKMTVIKQLFPRYSTYDEFRENVSAPADLFKLLSTLQTANNTRELILGELEQDRFGAFSDIPKGQGLAISSIKPSMWEKKSNEFHATLLQHISPDITDIEFIGNPHLTDNDLVQLIKNKVKLSRLIIKGCKNVRGCVPDSITYWGTTNWIGLAFDNGLRYLSLEDVTLDVKVAEYIFQCFNEHPDILFTIHPNCAAHWDISLLHRLSLAFPQTGLTLIPLVSCEEPVFHVNLHFFNFEERFNAFNPITHLPGGSFATRWNESDICVWQIMFNGEYKLLTLSGHSQAVIILQATIDGKLVSASFDSTIKIWSRNNRGKWECIHTLLGHQGQITTLVYINDKTILSAENENIYIWICDEKGQWSYTHPNVNHSRKVTSFALLPNGIVLSASLDNTLMFWKLKDNQLICVQNFNYPVSGIRAIAVLHNNMLVLGTSNGTLVFLHQNKNGTWISKESIRMHQNSINQISVFHDNRFISKSTDSTLLLWSYSPDGTMSCIEPTAFNNKEVLDFAILTDGKLVTRGPEIKLYYTDYLDMEDKSISSDYNSRLLNTIRNLLRRGIFTNDHLRLLLNVQFTELDISNTQISDQVLMEIMRNVPNLKLKNINIDGCTNLSAKMRLQHFCARNSNANHLIIDAIDETLDKDDLISFLKSNPNITELSVDVHTDLDRAYLFNLYRIGIRKILIINDLTRPNNTVFRLKTDCLEIDYFPNYLVETDFFYMLQVNPQIKTIKLRNCHIVNKEMIFQLHSKNIIKVIISTDDEPRFDTVFDLQTNSSGEPSINVYESLCPGYEHVFPSNYPAAENIYSQLALLPVQPIALNKPMSVYTASANLSNEFSVFGTENGVLILICESTKKVSDSTKIYSKHNGQILFVAFLPDGRLISAGIDGHLNLWILKNKGLHFQENIKVYDKEITSLSVFKNNTVTVGLSDGIVELIQLNHSMHLHIFKKLQGHMGAISKIQTLPDNTIITSSSDSTIKIWKQNQEMEWKLVQTLTDHTNVVSSICFTPDGIMVSCSLDSTIKFWKFIDNLWKLENSISEDNSGFLSINVITDGSVFSHSQDGHFKIWHQNNGHYQCVQAYSNIQHSFKMYDGTFILTSDNGERNLYNFCTQKNARLRALSASNARLANQAVINRVTIVYNQELSQRDSLQNLLTHHPSPTIQL